MSNELIHSMQLKVIGGYMNAKEMLPAKDADAILKTTLDEAIFTNTTLKAIVRAINKIKESGAEVCELNVTYFLEKHGMPRNMREAEEISRVQAEYAITPRSFNDYLKHIKAHRGRKVAL